MSRLVILSYILTNLILSSIYPQELEKLKNFADNLREEGEYYRAITEYMRINSYFPSNKYYTDNLLQISECYYRAGHYIEAIESYDKILNYDSSNWNAILKTIECLTPINDFVSSNNFIDKHLNNFQGGKKDTLFVLKGINYVKLRSFEKAKSNFGMVSQNGALYEKSIHYIELLDNFSEKQFKKKNTSVFLNLLIPGSGYIYTGRKQTGYSSIVVNMFFGYLTYLSFQNDNSGSGYLSGFLFISFYSGAIWGSIQAVNSYNKKLLHNFSSKFKL